MSGAFLLLSITTFSLLTLMSVQEIYTRAEALFHAQ